MGPDRQSWPRKFAVAFHGVLLGVHGQSSFLVHFVMTALVCVAAIVLRLDEVHWCLLLFAIALVVSAELFNSALEWLARAITDKHDERIGNALDIGSGAVLIASIGAALVGGLVFGHRLWELWAE